MRRYDRAGTEMEKLGLGWRAAGVNVPTRRLIGQARLYGQHTSVEVSTIEYQQLYFLFNHTPSLLLYTYSSIAVDITAGPTNPYP